MSIPKYIPHYTYEDYCYWEGAWELIDGIPVAMRPTPGPQHQRIGGTLFQIFDSALEEKCKQCLTYPAIDWLVKDDTVLRPDLLIAYDLTEKKYLDYPPLLVAEIMSPCTVIKDRHAKYQIYESQKVRYYLIIDMSAEKTEIYELTASKYQSVAVNPDTFQFSFDGCSVVASFSQLWH